MEKPRTAWQESEQSVWPDETWSIEQLHDQFQKAVDLCTLSEENIEVDGYENDSLNNPGPNDHNLDVNKEGEDGARRVSEPYKNKYTARIFLIEMKTALSRKYDNFSKAEQQQVPIRTSMLADKC